MNLTAQLTALREETRGLTPVERARRCCDLAMQLEKAGEYEAACEALSEFWPKRDGPLKLNDLDEATRAEVLLRVGALAGWPGSTDQTEGSQETAKDLITQSIDLFQHLGLPERVTEARADLALCYWREGSYDEARATLAEALDSLGERDSDLRALLLIRAGIIEARTQQLHEAMRLYSEAAPLLDRSEDHALKGTFHNGYGSVFQRLATPENREDYLDRALMEYTAASFHFELAGNSRFLSRVENNLGHLFFTIGKYEEAHKHLDRARHLFFAQNDVGAVAQVDDTRARTLLAENRLAAAELLKQSQDPSTSKRLIACAQKVIEGLRTREFQAYEAKDLSWASFKREIRKAEKALLARALRDAEGSVTKAAHLLGFKHHQSLISIINIRHKDLLKTRSRIRKRRRHIFSQSRKTRKTPPKLSPVRRTSQISILQVADNAQAAKVFADIASENWRVELCHDGDSALRKLTGEEHYDLLVVDNDLPELNGLELIRRARRITRRRRTPIIMLSASDCERDAWRAGVNAFLKKPEQIDELPTTVARLLTDKSNDG